MGKLDVHPVAALFPMLADDELDELAADIKERGLLQPIVLDAEGRILDGRNRLAACEKAGVKPTFRKFTGDDADGYALAVNINRRHLSKGQRAMAVAMVYPEPEKAHYGKRAAQTEKLLAAKTFSGPALSQAPTVLKSAPDLADLVLAGSKPLNDAYAAAVGASPATVHRDIAASNEAKNAPNEAAAIEVSKKDILSAAVGASKDTVARDLGRRDGANEPESGSNGPPPIVDDLASPRTSPAPSVSTVCRCPTVRVWRCAFRAKGASIKITDRDH